MTQRITFNGVKNNINTSHRKENNFYKEFALFATAGGIKNLATLRIYHTNTTALACLWVHNEKALYTAGSGKAGGYGYHKASASSHEAFENAGFTLKESISGVGDDAIEKALLALGKMLGYRKLYIHIAHA